MVDSTVCPGDHIECDTSHAPGVGAFAVVLDSLEIPDWRGQVCYIRSFLRGEAPSWCDACARNGPICFALHLCSSGCPWRDRGLTWNERRKMHIIHATRWAMVMSPTSYSVLDVVQESSFSASSEHSSARRKRCNSHLDDQLTKEPNCASVVSGDGGVAADSVSTTARNVRTRALPALPLPPHPDVSDIDVMKRFIGGRSGRCEIGDFCRRFKGARDRKAELSLHFCFEGAGTSQDGRYYIVNRPTS